MELQEKEVLYSQYCSSCVHEKVLQEDEPCNTCLGQPWNDYTHRPIKYEPTKDDKIFPRPSKEK